MECSFSKCTMTEDEYSGWSMLRLPVTDKQLGKSNSAPPALGSVFSARSMPTSSIGSALSNLSTASSTSIEHYIDADLIVPHVPCVTPREQ